MECEINSLKISNSSISSISTNSTTTVPVLDSNNLFYKEFFYNFMLKNAPCVIKNVANNWESSKKWVENDKPNLNYLYNNYKDHKVIIYNCSERYYNSQKCEEGTFAQYLELSNNNNNNTEKIYYLKDWHLKAQCAENDHFYNVPIYFASDWLNEYFINCTDDDYRFVYLGKKGSWTPLHADVFNSFSWSVNICGRKRWIFYPPGKENLLRDKQNNIPYDISDIVENSSKNIFQVIQNPGEAVFVPSGWYHQVWNLEDTLSINHNWINGCNINMMWINLKETYEKTKKEIDDCKDMDNFEEHCQKMLKVLYGINFKEFYQFLRFIAEKRLKMIQGKIKSELYHGHFLGPNHILFDLCCIKEVLEIILQYEEIQEGDIYRNIQKLLKDVEDFKK